MSALADVLEGYLDLRWRINPVEGTFVGRHEFDSELPRLDSASLREYAAALRSYAVSLEEVEAPSLDDEIDRTATLHAARHDLLVLEREKPHARNPVRSDPRGSRPAGALDRKEGALYRQAQVGVPRFGAGLSIRRVRRLTPEEFAELEVARIMPAQDAGLLGLHTVNRAGALTVVDAFTRRWRF